MTPADDQAEPLTTADGEPSPAAPEQTLVPSKGTAASADGPTSPTHHHSLDGRQPSLRSARRWTLLLLVPAVLATAVGMLLLWPHDTPSAASSGDSTQVLGEVVTVSPEPCPPVPESEETQPQRGAPEVVCGTITVKLTSGAHAGTPVTTEIPNGPGALRVTTGDDVVLLVLQDEPGGAETYTIMDYQRSQGLWMLGAAFALAVIAFGRWRGLTALAGLGLTFAVLLIFVVPAILDGRSPVLVAVVGSAAIMLTVLYLTHGFTITTSIAVAGTLASLTITAALSAIATAGTHLSGIADETANNLNITQGDVNMQGLLLAGIVIGSLGVLDDVTVTQSVTVTELAVANPAYGFRRLYAAATRIGRAHIASVINTIVLAYAGASLPLMLLIAASDTPVGQLLTGELIAQELVRSAVGTIGLISAVPITTALAAMLATRGTRPAPAPIPDSTDDGTPAEPVPVASARPADDPWAAFVERHPSWRDGT